MYYVDSSVELRRHLKQLYQKAVEQGRGDAFAVAVRSIYERISQDPLVFGEPLFSLPMLRLQIRTAAISPLSVAYSVSKDHRFVVIKDIHLMGNY